MSVLTFLSAPIFSQLLSLVTMVWTVQFEANLKTIKMTPLVVALTLCCTYEILHNMCIYIVYYCICILFSFKHLFKYGIVTLKSTVKVQSQSRLSILLIHVQKKQQISFSSLVGAALLFSPSSFK